MPDTTDRHLTIGDAITAANTAMRFHCRQAESYAENGEDTEEDQAAERFHRASVRQLVAALSVLEGPQAARDAERMAWQRAARETTGD